MCIFSKYPSGGVFEIFWNTLVFHYFWRILADRCIIPVFTGLIWWVEVFGRPNTPQGSGYLDCPRYTLVIQIPLVPRGIFFQIPLFIISNRCIHITIHTSLVWYTWLGKDWYHWYHRSASKDIDQNQKRSTTGWYLFFQSLSFLTGWYFSNRLTSSMLADLFLGGPPLVGPPPGPGLLYRVCFWTSNLSSWYLSSLLMELNKTFWRHYLGVVH